MTPEYYAAHREEIIAKQKAYYWANVERIRPKKREYSRQRRLDPAIREMFRHQQSARTKADPGRVRRAHIKSRLKTRYGLTVEQYRDLLVGQAGQCLICLRTDRQLVVDHHHGSGAVRGLVCGLCNTLLGAAGDDRAVLLRAAAYLDLPPVPA